MTLLDNPIPSSSSLLESCLCVKSLLISLIVQATHCFYLFDLLLYINSKQLIKSGQSINLMCQTRDQTSELMNVRLDVLPTVQIWMAKILCNCLEHVSHHYITCYRGFRPGQTQTRLPCTDPEGEGSGCPPSRTLFDFPGYAF